MAYQPFPASGAPATAPTSGRRSPVLLIVGVVVLVVGVVAGIVLVLGASSTTEDSVKNLGRAVPGCETTLDFKETGTFLLFFERKGSTPELDGCSGTGQDFDRNDDEVPDQTLTLVDPDGADVDIADDSGVSYDTGGFIGEQIGEVQIDDAGKYTLTVTPDDPTDTEYAIAIGRDPTANESTMRVAGIAALAVGIVAGALLIALGLRRRGGSTGPGAATAAVPGAWAPGGTPPPTAAWPTTPSAPPTGPPSTVPSFGSPSPTPPPWSAGPTTSFGGPGGQPAPPSGGWPPADATRPQPAPDPFSRPPGA